MLTVPYETGIRLKQARIQAGYKTAKDFYEKFRIKPSTYSAHEAGRNPLSLKIAKQYAHCLSVSENWLLTGAHDQQEELEKYALNYGEVPRDHLLNKMLNDVTVQHLKHAGLRRGMNVLELGCGTGSMTCWIAEYIGESSKIYAIDKNYEQLSITQRRAEELNIHNIETIRSEISLAAPLPSIQADFIYSRCFLHHLKHPQQILNMILELLPQHGALMCMEPIISSFWAYPEIPEMEEALGLYLKLGKTLELDFDIGKRLYSYLFQTNQLHEFTISILHGISISKLKKSWIEMITTECAAKYIELGLITEPKMDAMITAIKHHIKQEGTLSTLPQFVCLSAKKK